MFFVWCALFFGHGTGLIAIVWVARGPNHHTKGVVGPQPCSLMKRFALACRQGTDGRSRLASAVEPCTGRIACQRGAYTIDRLGHSTKADSNACV